MITIHYIIVLLVLGIGVLLGATIHSLLDLNRANKMLDMFVNELENQANKTKV